MGRCDAALATRLSGPQRARVKLIAVLQLLACGSLPLNDSSVWPRSKDYLSTVALFCGKGRMRAFTGSTTTYRSGQLLEVYELTERKTVFLADFC